MTDDIEKVKIWYALLGASGDEETVKMKLTLVLKSKSNKHS